MIVWIGKRLELKIVIDVNCRHWISHFLRIKGAYVSEINVAGSLLFISTNFIYFAINPDNKAYICPVYLTANKEIFSLQSRPSGLRMSNLDPGLGLEKGALADLCNHNQPYKLTLRYLIIIALFLLFFGKNSCATLFFLALFLLILRNLECATFIW